MASEQEAWAKISRKRTEEALGRLAASIPNGEFLLTMSLAGLFDAAAKAVRERDEAIARAEAAERALAAVREALRHPSHKDYKIVAAVRDALGGQAEAPATAHGAHLVSVARLAASLPVDEDAADPIDRSWEQRRPISRRPEPRAWQRKPITHEWRYVGAVMSVRSVAGWLVGSETTLDDRGLSMVPLCRPIEPAKGSERGDA